MKGKQYVKPILLVGMFFLLVALDQFTKFLAVSHLKGKKGVLFIKNILSFEYLENHGAAWGIFAGKTEFLLIITIIFSIVLCVFIVQIERALQAGTCKIKLYTLIQTVLVILVAGAVGNVIDRIRLSYVVDFIKFEFIDFPIFNVADCYVTVSSFILLIVVTFFMKDEDFPKKESKKQTNIPS